MRGDLRQQITLVAQRDEVIGKLRDQAISQWASGWLTFQQKAVHVYSDFDFNFDLPSDEEAEESFSANYSQLPPHHRLFLLLTPKFLYSSLPA